MATSQVILPSYVTQLEVFSDRQAFSNRKIHCIRCFLSFFNLLLFFSCFVRFRSLDVWLLLCYLMILIHSYMALMLMHSLHLEMHRWKSPITYINIWGVQAFSFAQQVTSLHVTSITSGFCKIPSLIACPVKSSTLFTFVLHNFP